MIRSVELLWAVENSFNELNTFLKTKDKHEKSWTDGPVVQKPQFWVTEPEGSCELSYAAQLETKGSLV